MKRIGITISLSFLTSISIILSHGLALVLYTIYVNGIEFFWIDLPIYSRFIIYGMELSIFSFFLPSILGSVLLILSAQYIEIEWLGIIIGMITGVLVDTPYFLYIFFFYSVEKTALDYIVLLIPIIVFSLAGLHVYANGGWKDRTPEKVKAALLEMKTLKAQYAAMPNLPTPLSPELLPAAPVIKKETKPKNKQILLTTTFITITLGIFIFLGVFFYNHFTPFTLADNLWSFRIDGKLKDKGFIIQNLTISRHKTINLFSHMDITVGIEKNNKVIDYRDVVECVHKSIFESMNTSLFPPEPVGQINVALYDDGVGNHQVSVNYDTIQQYQLKNISRSEYIGHWNVDSQ